MTSMLQRCFGSIRLIVIYFAFIFLTPVQASDIDTELENALDAYVQLLQTEQDKAKTMLQKLWQRHEQNPAVQSWGRLVSYKITDSFNADNPEVIQPYLDRMLQAAKTTENANALSEIYGTELEILFYQRKINDAIIKADNLQYYLQSATEPRIRYYFNTVLGNVFKQDSQFSRALEHFILALDAVAETDNDATVRRRTALNVAMAQVYAELKNWPQAQEQAKTTLDDAIKYGFKTFIIDMYILQGYIAGYQKQFEDAIQINKLGAAYAKEQGNEHAVLTFENNLASSYVELERYDAAKAIFMQALERAARLKDEYSVELIKFNLAYIQVVQGDHQVGLAQMKAGMKYFSEKDSKAQFEPNYEWLAKAYAAADMYKEQAETLLEQMALQEEIRANERETRLNELQNRYDTKAKAQQITILEQENNLKAQLLENQHLQQKLTMLFVLVMLFGAVLLFQLYRRVRQSNRKLYETNKQLAYQSQRDPLTGLYNRRALQQHMQLRALKRRAQDEKLPLSGLLLLDIDFFKRINDHFGHAAGDAVLIDIAQRLQATCREQDIVVRWGGEEMLLVLDNIDLAHVSSFVQRILDVIGEQAVAFDNQQISLTVSGGFIHLPFAGISEAELDWEKVLQIADMALYLSKTNGRNQVCMLEGLNARFSDVESQLYSDLAGAIRAGQVQVSTISGPGGNVS